MTNIPPIDPANWDEYRTLAHRMLDESLDYLRDVRERPTWQPMPAAYLAAEARGLMPAGGIHFADRGIELTRSFKALKVWMTMRAQGTDLLGQHIARNIDQAAYLATLVRAEPELELLAPVPLNLVNFRYVAAGLSAEELNALNKEILVRLQEEGVAVPSGTTIRGAFSIRVAITNHRSREDDFDALVAGVLRHGRARPR